MIHNIHIEADATPAMLEQILRTARVRGFRIHSLEVKNPQDEGRYQVSMTVDSQREEARLTSQLAKLPGVRELRALHAVQNEPAEQFAACAG
jgi:acetolactate synthase II small subunit